MGRTRRLILLGLVVFVGLLVYHGFRPARWTSITVPPAATPAISVQTVTYVCGPAFGAAYVHPPKNLPAASDGVAYPIDGVPCGSRRTDRIMIGADLILGALAIVATLAWPRQAADLEFA